MKKCVAVCAVLAALVWVGVAVADTAQGKLTGSASVGGGNLTMNNVIDGGTSYVGLENDYSGNCNGDSGSVTTNRGTFNIVCAHYVASSGCCNAGSPKMRFAWFEGGSYTVVRITDNVFQTDTVAVSRVSTLGQADAWVNLGAIGSGNAALGWTYWGNAGSPGSWLITASQA